MDEMLEEFLTYCRKNINAKSRVKSVAHVLEKLRKEVYVMTRTNSFIIVFRLIRNYDSITREFIKVISNTWRDMCEEMFFLFRAYDVLSGYEYCQVLKVLKRLTYAVCPGTINPEISTNIMESVENLIKIVGHDDALTRKILRFRSVNRLDGCKDVLDFILKVRSAVDPREHNRLATMVNKYRQGMFGGKSIIECVERIAIEVSTDNGYLGERFMKFVRESEGFDVTHEILIVPDKTDFKWNSDLDHVDRMYEEVFSKGGTSNGQRMLSETDRDYRNNQIGNHDEAGSNENVAQLNDLSASWDENFRSESQAVSDNGENFNNLNIQSFGLTLNQLLGNSFNPQVNPYDLQVQSSFFNPQSSSLNPQTTSFNPQTSSLNPQASSSNPQANSFNLQASSLNPQTTSLNPQASSSNPQANSLYPQPSSFNSQVNSFNPRANSLNPQAYYNHKADSTKNMVQSDNLSLSRYRDFWIQLLAAGGKRIDDSQVVGFDQGDMVKKEDTSGWLSNDSERGKSKTDEVDANGKIGDNLNPGCKTVKTTHPNDDFGSHDMTESRTKIEPYLKIPVREEKTKGKMKTVQSVCDRLKMWVSKSKVVDEVNEKQLSDNDSSAIGGVEKESDWFKTCDSPKRDWSKGTGKQSNHQNALGDKSKFSGDLNDKSDHKVERIEQGKKEESDAPKRTKSFQKGERKRKFKE